MSVKPITADIDIREVLNDLLRKFEGIDGSGFKVYYRKYIVPKPLVKRADLPQTYSDCSDEEDIRFLRKIDKRTYPAEICFANAQVEKFWKETLPCTYIKVNPETGKLDPKTSYPDFLGPTKLEDGREVRFALVGENVSEGWWKFLRTPVQNTVKILGLRSFDIANMPDVKTIITGISDRPCTSGSEELWFELLLSFGLNFPRESLIAATQCSNPIIDGKSLEIHAEGLTTDALEASIKAVKYLLQVAGKVIEEVQTSGETGETHNKPDDLITLLVAVKEYSVSRATLKRAIKAGNLESYRKRNTPRNSTHMISRKDIEKYYNKR